MTHLHYVLLAYGVSAAVIFGLVFWLLITGAVLRRRLRRLRQKAKDTAAI